MSDDEFLHAFESCTLPRALWTHEAHVRMAWLTLQHDSFEQAVENVRCGIQAYNLSLGNATGYHDTVTVAYLRLIADRKRRDRSISFTGFKAGNADLFDRSTPILLRFYSKDLIESGRARAEFVEPDLQPLP